MPRIRTGFSFKNAVGKIEAVTARLVECKYPVAPISDRASAFGWVRWADLAKKHGLRPVFGLELGVVESLNAKKPVIDYWTFFAKDSLVPLHELFEMATTQFRYEPLITYKQAQETDLLTIVGYRANLDLIKPKSGLFVGLAPSVAKGYIKKVIEKDLPFVACSDNKFPTPDDIALYEIICGRGASTQTYDQFIQTDEQWIKSVERFASPEIIEEALKNRKYIFDSSKAELKKGTMLVPEKPKTLRDMCLEGAERLGIDLTNQVYQNRLDYELGMIATKKFEDYFYIISDLCRWARSRMIVGPARGSSCGSLVCYCLGITTVDPIPYGLIFERFIDLNREDLPDIDIDFSDQKRQMVFDYLIEKYGAEHVARLGAIVNFKADSALGLAGKALKVPKWKCDAVSESLLKRSSGDARALDSLKDTFQTMPAGKELLASFPEMAIAGVMEGHPDHYTQHAAGIILTNEQVKNYVAIDRRTGAAQCDKKDAEKLNLLKIDALGLTQLSVFEDALEMAGLDRLILEHIPMEDPEAFKILNDGKFAGVFQFNGIALQSIVKQFKVDCLDDIVSITALARPGPLASGGAHEWVRRRNGVNPITYPHPMFEPYLKKTRGVVLYQEQVMEIGRNIGDLSWNDVTQLRKSMSKSLGKEYFNQWGDKWKTGAIAKGGDPKLMEKVWDDLCSYGSWSFNLSHAVAYGIISYQCCWMKAHYPFEFAAATLSHETVPEKQIKLLREMAVEGYNYVPVDAEKSVDKWIAGIKDGKKILIGPVNNVKGIGPKMIQAIMSARARNEVLPSRIQKLLSHPKTPIDSLFPITDAFHRILPDPATKNIFTPPTKIIDIKISQKDYDVLVFCTLSKINPRDENEAVNIARRGGKKMEGPLTASLNLQLSDDTDTVFGKVSRWDYEHLGKEIVDRGRPGKCLYAIKGTVKGGSSFRMIKIKQVRYIGDMSEN